MIRPGPVPTHGGPMQQGMIEVFDEFTIEQNGSSYRHDGSETTLTSPPPE